jgi:hypothetical protein
MSSLLVGVVIIALCVGFGLAVYTLVLDLFR